MSRAIAVAFAVVASVLLTFESGHAAGIGGAQGGDSFCSVTGATAGNRAGLVVTFDDGRTLTYCIEFASESITGAELLQRSGLSVVTATSGVGSAVCSIDGEGCNDPGACFCHCGGGTCEYWVYRRYVDGAWQYSPIGAGSRTIRDGDADAWVWGSGDESPGASGAVCPELTPTPSPAPTAAPSATPRPTNVASLAPTPRPTSVASPAATPVAGAPSPTIAASPPTATAAVAAPPTSTAPGATPTSAVRAATELPSTSSTVTPSTGGSAEASPAASRTPSGTPAAGVISVSSEQGEQNLSRQGGGGSWAWRSTTMFGAVAIVLVGAGGALLWRRRAGI